AFSDLPTSGMTASTPRKARLLSRDGASQTSPENTMRLRPFWFTCAASVKRWFGRATEPVVLFPLFAVLVLGLIWGTTLNLITVERNNAEKAALVSSQEIVETYEAQVMRTLSGIEQTLKFVKHSYEINNNLSVLYG